MHVIHVFFGYKLHLQTVVHLTYELVMSSSIIGKLTSVRK